MTALTLYNFNTPNGVKIHLALEEMGLDYETKPIDISQDEQFAPDFLKISPNNKIPALVDSQGPDGKPIALFESGAILLYLAEKTGKFLPSADTPSGARARYECLKWLFWQMGGFGPMLGQAHHFIVYAPEPIPYGIERYSKEAQRLYGVLDKRLGEAKFVGGDEYSIADMAIWPWARFPERQQVDSAGLKNFQRWFAEIAARPATTRAQEVLAAACE